MAKVEQFHLEDGRQAERHTSVTGECEELKVVEVYAEDVRPKKLVQRVQEKTRPVIVERTIETIDSSGEVVERKVEAVEPEVQMELRRHIMRDDSEELPCNTPDEPLPPLAASHGPDRGPTQQRVSAFNAAAERAGSPDKKAQVWTVVGVAVIAAQVAGLAWLIFVF